MQNTISFEKMLILEPFIGVVISSLIKRGFGDKWSYNQSIGIVLELLVDYIILIFLVFMATQFKAEKLEYTFFSNKVVMTKGGWVLCFMVAVFLATLCWKQSKKQVLATVKLKSDPDWLSCLLWSIPNLSLMILVTHFIFNIEAI
ncbi:MAG: hypothetical protein ACPGVT_04100 [Maricaulaceae bacterium]